MKIVLNSLWELWYINIQNFWKFTVFQSLSLHLCVLFLSTLGLKYNNLSDYLLPPPFHNLVWIFFWCSDAFPKYLLELLQFCVVLIQSHSLFNAYFQGQYLWSGARLHIQRSQVCWNFILFISIRINTKWLILWKFL